MARTPTQAYARATLALLAVVAFLARPSSTSAQSDDPRTQSGDRERRRMHREALASIASGSSLLALAQLPIFLSLPDHRLPAPGTEDHGATMMELWAVLDLGVGGTQSFLGAGLVTARARALGIRDGVSAPRIPFRLAFLGQFLAWVPTAMLGFLATSRLDVPSDGTQREVARQYLVGAVLPELTHIVAGSYLAACIVERSRPRRPESRAIVQPFVARTGLESPGVLFGVRGAF